MSFCCVSKTFQCGLQRIKKEGNKTCKTIGTHVDTQFVNVPALNASDRICCDSLLVIHMPGFHVGYIAYSVRNCMASDYTRHLLSSCTVTKYKGQFVQKEESGTKSHQYTTTHVPSVYFLLLQTDCSK